MACNCKKDLEEKLLERFKEQSPEANGHCVSLQGYALIFGEKLEQKGCMTIASTASFPLKKGGMKEKRQTQNMVFTYCPFCAEKY
ncbi:hypothetical protein [Massilia endophytica]|uniref:hypothetical protein n=1 Tax=Massilia endophytica TaxID=2899220 RepID=UPI001E3B82FB|nr:hypothetical protein [Massilia endophytica]UGQ44946.1 hypothetical protein LSQ66_14180 [Massilia endophytica]